MRPGEEEEVAAGCQEEEAGMETRGMMQRAGGVLVGQQGRGLEVLFLVNEGRKKVKCVRGIVILLVC